MLLKASCFLCIGLLIGTIVAEVQAETQTIQFSELAEFANAHSPRSKIIGYEFDRARSARDMDLQWSNPELSYDREKVDPVDERQITLSKEFEMPWVYLKKRSSWNDRISAAGLRKEQSKLDNLANLKTGYVRLQLLGEYLDRLGQLKEILTDASHIATTRHTEGHLSGVEEHLVQMSVISLNASYHSARHELHENTAMWRANAGVPIEDSLILATKIEYQSIELKPSSHYVGLIESQPGLKSRTLLRQGLSKRASAESAVFIPSLNIYGGQKRIDSDQDGYVAGVSLSIPLLNRNGAASRKYKTESAIASSEAELYRSQLIGHIQTLVEVIPELQHSLSVEADHFNEDTEALNNLLYSYDEGWMNLNELLNAIQIEVNGLRDYYDQLIHYYENIFTLEALTGETLGTF